MSPHIQPQDLEGETIALVDFIGWSVNLAVPRSFPRVYTVRLKLESTARTLLHAHPSHNPHATHVNPNASTLVNMNTSITKSTTATGTGVSRGTGDVWHPYVNDPSYGQRILEVVSYLIIIASIPAFLGGVYSCFVMAYGAALGLLGMHAWTRRHSLIFILSAAVFGVYLVVVIILNAVRRVSTVVPNYEPTTVGGIDYGTGQFNGSRIFTYIDHGILIFLTAFAFFVAIKVAGERRPEPGTLVHQTVTSSTSVPQCAWGCGSEFTKENALAILITRSYQLTASIAHTHKSRPEIDNGLWGLVAVTRT
ncbi:hypothetical protein PROFUN_06745 [Planoprotostelium fungivorum]|uniref:Uncharacterized protein n=1 Tax=Planoprotostelium fungivorum TaxID=1890364 RepID=A0A2P6NNI1_9EUKA|nr:hypothetical protein PROFUN_06745 [Planoprotostelium fungivorum]